MSTVIVGRENSADIEINYEDFGGGYDTFAADLSALLEHLDVRDSVLVGHSMGTGEVTRYLSSYGSARVAKGVLVSPIPPFLRLVVIEGGPHAIPWTHAGRLNDALLDFIRS